MPGVAPSFTDRIRSRALELGFHRAGFSPAGRAQRAAAFDSWLARGEHGAMEYMARQPEARADPRVAYDWARSIVSVAMNYLPVAESGSSNAGEPRESDWRSAAGGLRTQWSAAPGILSHLARYAAGEDYHEVVRERLEDLLAFVRDESPGVRGRIAVDSSAFLERDIAERSGVGWLAKNTMIIDTAIGSWTFLGELVLDRELDYDTPVDDRCGSCRACIDACPTLAIGEERTLDARRCISYLTIELKGAIPREHRAAVENHLFGCDICQEVCPWNRKAPTTTEARFAPRAAHEEMALVDIVRMTGERFRETFRETPLFRSKRRGLVRNALIVGANIGDGAVLAAAEESLLDADPVVRSSAAWAMARGAASGAAAGGDRLGARLEAAFARETDPAARVDIAETLGGRKDGD